MFRSFFMGFFFIVNAFALGLEDLPSKANIHLLFARAFADMKVNIVEDDREVHFQLPHGTKDEVEHRLYGMLSSGEGFLHYFRGGNSFCFTKPNCASFAVEQRDEALELVKKLFGNIFEEQAFDSRAFITHEAYFTDGVLSSRHFLKRNMQTLQGFQKGLLSCFVDADIHQVQEAFSSGPSLATNDAEFSDEGLVGLMKHSLRISVSGSHACLAVDLKRIHELCHPPVIKEAAMEDGSILLAINKSHLIRYIKQMLLGEIVLRHVKCGEEVFQNQLFLTEKFELDKTPLVSFIVDRSGSLANEISALKASLIEAIDEVWEKAPHTKIRVTFFESSKQFIGEFTRDKRETLVTAIAKMVAGGSTRMLETIREEIEELVKNKMFVDHSIYLVLFTDGRETQNRNLDLMPCVNRCRKEDKKFTAVTLGFGSDCDQEMLTSIAQATYGRNLHVRDMKDFLKLLGDSLDCNYQQKLEKVILKLHEEAMAEALVPVQQNCFGVYPSPIFVKDETDPSIPCELASPDEVNRIKLSVAYFAARDLLLDTSISSKKLDDISDTLKSKNDQATAFVVDQFRAVISKHRENKIIEADAIKQLDNWFGIYSKQ